MASNGERMTHCLVGEPTCPNEMGEMMKIGRRGSMTCYFTAVGVQGHSAYPHRAKNPMSALVTLMARLEAEPDAGTAHFDASTLAITTIDCGNKATNVIPAKGTATVNIRFNDAHSGASLAVWLENHATAVQAETGVEISLRVTISGESFLTPPGEFLGFGRARGAGGDRAGAGIFDVRRHFGRALCEGSLPGGGIRAGRQDHASGR